MTRICLIYAPSDKLLATQITAELHKLGASVREGDPHAADIAVVVMSALALADGSYLQAFSALKAARIPLFVVYAGSEQVLRGDLPSELSFLRFQDWYDSADTPSWVSAFIETFLDEAGMLRGALDGDDPSRGLPEGYWGNADKEESAPPDEDTSRGWTHAKPPESQESTSPSIPETVPPPAVVPPPPQPSVIAPLPSEQLSGTALAAAAEPVAFSAYYPKEVMPDTWQPLKAYVYKESAQAATKQDAAKELGVSLADFRPVSDGARVPVSEGAVITVTPALEGFQFNPSSAQIAFFKDWHRLDFELRAKTAPLDQAANGRITFSVEGVIAADLPMSIFVSESAAMGAGMSPQPTVVEAKPYQAIFCSYSHKDTAIVERVERAIKLLGHTFLRDATTLRSGEQWNPALLRMIDRADIFQLFWSSAAAQSKYVQQEWEYALQAAAARGLEIFIRPVYWEEPMPKPPQELSAIHFAFDPTLDDDL